MDGISDRRRLFLAKIYFPFFFVTKSQYLSFYIWSKIHTCIPYKNKTMRIHTLKQGWMPWPTLPCPVNKYFCISRRKGRNREVFAGQNVHETHLTRTQFFTSIFSPKQIFNLSVHFVSEVIFIFAFFALSLKF